jgi:hypothetical protein
MFTSEEKELICSALHMRKNVIETGDPILSAADIMRMGKNKPELGHGVGIRALTVDQMRLIIAIDDLMTKVLKS